jgi:hypothetical protein
MQFQPAPATPPQSQTAPKPTSKRQSTVPIKPAIAAEGSNDNSAAGEKQYLAAKQRATPSLELPLESLPSVMPPQAAKVKRKWKSILSPEMIAKREELDRQIEKRNRMSQEEREAELLATMGKAAANEEPKIDYSPQPGDRGHGASLARLKASARRFR